MFHNNLKVYLYPMKDFETGQNITSNNLKLHPRMKDFYTTGRPLPGYEGEFIYNPFNHLDEFKNYGSGKSIQT